MARFNPGTLTAAVFAVLLGLGGAVTVRQFLAEQKMDAVLPAATRKAAKVFVPVAAVDLRPGQRVTMNDIAIFSFSPEDYAKSRFAGKPFMSDSRQIAERMLKTEIPQGDVFIPAAFYPDGMGPGLADQLRPGYRAITVPIQNVGAVAGFARPGSFVDVIFRSAPVETRPEVTLTLLEMVEVLAINQTLHPDVSLPDGLQEGTVTLAVTPPQAKALKVVEARGELSLALRNPDDVGNILPVNNSTAQRLTIEDILGLPGPEQRERIEVYLAGKKSVVEFEGYRRPISDDRTLPGLISTPVAADPDRAGPFDEPVLPVSTGRELPLDPRVGGS